MEILVKKLKGTTIIILTTLLKEKKPRTYQFTLSNVLFNYIFVIVCRSQQNRGIRKDKKYLPVVRTGTVERRIARNKNQSRQY